MKKILQSLAAIGRSKGARTEQNELNKPISGHIPKSEEFDPKGFADLGLLPTICKAVEREGYTKPTPIQMAAIPELLKGRDLLGCAQTGTGKTAAFALPILQRLSENNDLSRGIKALILTPTRELAIQVADSFHSYGILLKLKYGVIVGGVGMEPQKTLLRRGVDILVATPGRLLDLKSQGFVDLSKTSIFVLDEADRMLDMGFIHDVKKIIAELPKVRQNLLFSATMPEEIASLTKSLLKNPITIEVTPVASTSDQISQTVYFVERNDKRKLLLSLIQEQNIERAIVFTRTKAIANRVTGYLDDSGISAEAIHGNKSQNARQRALENFREGKTRILVASDLAARGLDVDLITHVFNYDLPNIPETYVHRIGRTGRAEAVGQAISFCDFEERLFLRQIEKVIGKSIPVIRDHPFASSGQAAGRDGSGNSGARPQGQHQSSRQGGQRPQARREPSPRHPSSATPRPSHGGSKGPNNAGRRSTNSDKTQKR